MTLEIEIYRFVEIKKLITINKRSPNHPCLRSPTVLQVTVTPPRRTGPDRPRDPLRRAAGVSSGCSSKIRRPAVIYNSTQKHFSLFDSGKERKQECPPKLVETLEDGRKIAFWIP
ncbi:unnamed protein product [Musa acuminata var. zebrina]